MSDQASLSVYGGRDFPIGLPGQVADLAGDNIRVSRSNIGATAIDFGVAVARGTGGAGRTCKAVGLDADVIIGISIREAFQMAASTDGNNTVNFALYAMVPVMRRGRIWVLANEAVTEGDQALSITASAGAIGGVTSGAAGAGRVVIPNAQWLTTTASGSVGCVEINMP